MSTLEMKAAVDKFKQAVPVSARREEFRGSLPGMRIQLPAEILKLLTMAFDRS